jgi:GH24 family phage-related lysozyme (muramidase)
MKISKTGINLIKRYEGLRLKAYKAVATEKYYTIGYGHYGADVTKDMVITEPIAEELLRKDLDKFEHAVVSLNRRWTQSQYDALVSFTFNCGVENLKRLVKDRDTLQIADAFLLYNRAGGRVLTGLVKRRKEERILFLHNDESERIAREVIDGKWGNGKKRKELLTAAGYDYNNIQRIVNRILTGE